MQEGETDEYKIKYANNIYYHTLSCLSPPMTFPPTTKKKKRPNLNPNHSEERRPTAIKCSNTEQHCHLGVYARVLGGTPFFWVVSPRE